MLRNTFWKFSWLMTLLISFYLLLNAVFYPGKMRDKGSLIFSDFYIIAIVGTILFVIFAIMTTKRKTQSFFCGLLIIIQISVQIYLIFKLKGAQGTDDFDMRLQAQSMAYSWGNATKWPPYFSFAPNNVGSTILFSWIIRLGLILKFKNISIILNAFLMLFIDGAVFCAGLMLENSSARKIYILISGLFLPLFATCLILYGDPIALSFSVFGIFLVHLSEKDNISKISEIVYLSLAVIMMCIAFFSKTNAVIVLIAFVLYIVFKKQSFKKFICIILIAITMYGFSSFAYKQIQFDNGFKINKTYNFPYTYWMAIGLNSDTDGTNSKGNVDFWGDTAKYKTPARRNEYNIDLINKELKDSGPIGLLNLWSRKINVQWSMGSVGTESRGYSILSDSPKVYKYIFGRQNILFLSISQAIYIVSLIGVLFRCFKKIKFLNVSLKTSEDLSMLFFVGIFLFHMLMWETMERYAYLAVIPILLIGSNGILDLSKILNQKVMLGREKRTQLNWTFFGLIALLILGFSFDFSFTKSTGVYDHSILGQDFFRKSSFRMRPHQVLYERIFAKEDFDRAAINIPSSNSNDLETSLRRQNGLREDSSIIHHGVRGRYQLRVKNRANKPIQIQVLKSAPMDLLQKPVDGFKNLYLGITLIASDSLPVVSQAHYLLFFAILLLAILLSYFQIRRSSVFIL